MAHTKTEPSAPEIGENYTSERKTEGDSCETKKNVYKNVDLRKLEYCRFYEYTHIIWNDSMTFKYRVIWCIIIRNNIVCI